LIFMSTTAAEVFAGSSAPVNDIAESTRTRIIAVGPMTKARLEALGFRVTHVPFSYSSEGLIALMRNLGVKGKVIGLVRAKEASSYLRENLNSLGAEVFEVGAYEVSEKPDEPAYDDFRHRLLEGGVDVILFTSSFSVKAFATRLLSRADEELNRRLGGQVLVVAIGPSTARELESNGITISLVSPVHTVNGMIDALTKNMAKKVRNV
jgi:uroporphyrinogen-III synthase